MVEYNLSRFFSFGFFALKFDKNTRTFKDFWANSSKLLLTTCAWLRSSVTFTITKSNLIININNILQSESKQIAILLVTK